MNAALVPVRSVADAKKRLASSLDVAAREALALAMLADMIEALRAAPSIARVVVVSGDESLLEHARSLGAEVLEEGPPQGLNAAVANAARTLEADGVTRLLTIPGDVPLVTPEEVDALFATDPARHPVVLVPSAAGTGTNGLLTSPPTVIRSRFEGNSLDAHRAACREAGLEALVVTLPGFELDIDTPADLEALVKTGGGRRSAQVGSQIPPTATSVVGRRLSATR